MIENVANHFYSGYVEFLETLRENGYTIIMGKDVKVVYPGGKVKYYKTVRNALCSAWNDYKKGKK